MSVIATPTIEEARAKLSNKWPGEAWEKSLYVCLRALKGGQYTVGQLVAVYPQWPGPNRTYWAYVCSREQFESGLGVSDVN